MCSNFQDAVTVVVPVTSYTVTNLEPQDDINNIAFFSLERRGVLIRCVGMDIEHGVAHILVGFDQHSTWLALQGI